MSHVQVHQKHMFVIEEWIVISRGRGSRPERGGALSISSIVQPQHGVIGGAIKFIKSPLYPIGKFNELIQDRLDVRGTSSLIGEGTTKMSNCLCACRLIPAGGRRTKRKMRGKIEGAMSAKLICSGARRLPKVHAAGSRALRQDRQTWRMPYGP